MDTTAIDGRGLEPLQPDFRLIAAIRSRSELAAALASFQRVGRPFGGVAALARAKISAPYLSRPIAEEDFRFSGTVLTGVQESKPRWQTSEQ